MSKMFCAMSVSICMFASSSLLAAEADLPVGAHPAALSFPHFPDRVHAFVWRNWSLVEAKRLAEVLNTPVENVVTIATSMGLPKSQALSPATITRAYITILRRNWHLLPYEQLLQLLDMSAEELAFSLQEDDFLFIKLGSLKPKCAPLRYIPPAAETSRRAAQIKQLVQQHFGEQMAKPGEARFHFVDELSRIDPNEVRKPFDPQRRKQGLRFIYSYFAPFGDPLLNNQADPFPEGLLARLADVGVNGVWLHVVLRQLAPGGEHFPEFGEGHQTRLATLRRFVERAKRYGIGIYLYMNEPRAMPAEFFQDRPELAGISSRDLVTMCTSDPRVRQWMAGALSHVFGEVPDLAGVFTITASENPTNCAFAGNQAACSRCRHRTAAEIIAEVNATIAKGVHTAAPDARVIAWDWSWNGDGDASEFIEKLPRSVWLMSVSEWSKPITRGGVNTHVGEYSMSAVGPGPRALQHWKVARERGLKTVAKLQMNNTWEMAAVPFVPVMDLVAEHCANLAEVSIDGQLLSWSLGGYPSPNLQVAQRFAEDPGASTDSVLNQIAADRYSPQAAPYARQAWSAFSTAFREYPFGMQTLYFSPHLTGPANLFYAQPTGYSASMVGLPYDDLARWHGPYPPKVLAKQFHKVADQWSLGLDPMERVVQQATLEQRATARGDLRLAKTCQLHFASAANHVDFVLARDALAADDPTPDARKERQAQIRRILADEISNARELYALAKQDSRIGFEASNHYFYVPLDLAEKVINCHWIAESLAN